MRNGNLLGLTLLIACGLLPACGGGDGPAWTETSKKGGEGPEAPAPDGGEAPDDDDTGERPAPRPRPAPDEGDEAPDGGQGLLRLERVWDEGLLLDVGDLAWAAPGEIQFRVEITDPTTGQPATGVGMPRFRENGEDLGSEALFEIRRTQDLHVVLVLDLSFSMREARAFEALRAAARGLVEKLPRDARVAVVGFASEHRLLVDFDEPNALLETLSSLDAPEGRAGRFTNLWGAIVFGANHLARSTQATASRALVVFTDGRDNVAEADFEEAADALADTRAAVYAVGLGADVDATSLKRLTGEGRFTGVQRAGALEAVFDDVATRLADRQTIRYVTPKQKGTHTLDVEFGDVNRAAGFTLKFTLP